MSLLKNTQKFLVSGIRLAIFSVAIAGLVMCDKDEEEFVEPDDPDVPVVIPDDPEPDPEQGTDTGDEENPNRIEDTRDLTPESFTQLSLSGIDEQGRTVSPSDGDKTDKYVGLFYFLWCGEHSTNPNDINWLEENNPNALWGTTSGASSVGLYHYWGKPLYGYYHQSDEWVVRRHVELFINAGIDFLGLDVTNAVTYDTQVGILLDVLKEFEEQGFKVPQVMFLTKTNALSTASHVYTTWYAKSGYSSLWFSPNGKPMISCATSWSSSYDSMMSSFDVVYYQWPNEGVDYANGFAWMEWKYPQPYHQTSNMMSVSIAQHVAGWMSLTTQNWGRSYNFSTKTNEDSRVNEGLNYQSQWDTALGTNGLKIVFLTGWNEWQAIKFTDNYGNVYFVDQFNTNYSRDIEMMEDGYGDNYYMQTVENIRAFKSTGSSSYKIEQKTIDIDGSLSQWDDVKYVYRDVKGDARARSYTGSISGYSYQDNSNRNDIVTVKVATDKEYAYFYVETASAITTYQSGTNWMNILIGQGAKGGFEGYEYLINAAPNGDTTSVSKFTGNGFAYQDAGTAQLRVSGNVMLVQVELASIGVSSASNPYFAFKVCDNITKQDDIMDYYVSGDSAPLGRLSYTYGY